MNNRLTTGAVVGGLLLAAGGYYWLQSGRISDADRAKYGAECSQWIGSEFGSDSLGSLASIGDSWVKDGKLVFEVLVPQDDLTSSSVYLCVVDKKEGQLFKPSAFDTSWRK